MDTTPRPTGTVTFLFTDIEGSTQLWEQHPGAMRLALARHDVTLGAAIEAQGGCVFKRWGDQFCAAFSTATDALAAALAAQVALQAEPWDSVGPLRIRMALHSGAAEQRDEDYFGPPLNCVARLLEVGHGGQILLTLATEALVRDTLPEGTRLRSLGEHRLRDLVSPERVFQLLHPDLPSDFPPLRSRDVLSHNLPLQVTSFVGREKEMTEVRRLLGDTRLLTLMGVGGTGKTRLAMHVAAGLLGEFADGVWSVELAPLSDAALVPQAVASVLGIREEPGKPLSQTLVEGLRPKKLLLVLDNCEHLLDACASLADAVLRSCPGVQLLATSREGLNIPGEAPYRLPSLSAPDPQNLPTTPEGIGQYEAVQLFMDRATTVAPSFKLTDANGSAVAQVCHRLDGIPLALELAAARVKALPVERIAERLDDRFRLLTGGSRTALPRQQTLKALIDWSYDLLSEAERTLLRRLAVFAGGWVLEAAEAICTGEHPQSGSQIEECEVLDLLTSLVEKSLVVYEEQEGQGRYRLLETLRQYGRDRLLESGEAETVRGCHCDFFVGLAEQAEPELRRGEQKAWLDRLEVEHDNLRAALEWSLEGQRGVESGLRLGGALWWFWLVRTYITEGRRWLESALSRGVGVRTSSHVNALNGAAYLARIQGQLERAKELCAQALALAEELADRRGIALAHNTLGYLADTEDDVEQAANECAKSLSLWRELGDTWGVAFTLEQLGLLAAGQGEGEQAKAFARESLALFREVEDRRSIATSLWLLAWMATREREYGAARSYFEQILPIFQELRDKRNTAWIVSWLGRLAAYQGDHVCAARLLGAAGVLCDANSVSWLRGERTEYECQVANARTALGEAAFAAAWAEGRAMTLDDAVAFALAGTRDA